MYGYLEGFSETDDIKYCPRCGTEIDSHRADGTGKCPGCGFRFGVIEVPDFEPGHKDAKEGR